MLKIYIFEENKLYLDEMKKKAELLRKKDSVTILGIESSCDETSIAIVRDGREVLSNVISSQIDIHTKFGGVVPEVASRNHVMAINGVLEESLSKAGVKLEDIDAIAVTYGAGLIGALMVGVTFAKTLAFSLGVPLIAVNHIRGHMCANYISHKDLTPPFIGLIVSGGHTAICRVESFTDFKVIGSTLDDAIGECYDKVARVLGLGYPGGPKVDKLAVEGKYNIHFVKDNLKKTYDSSFSGLKTAVINYVHTLTQKGKALPMEDICASFQSEAVLPLVSKVVRACLDYGYDKICVAGGVSANKFLRNALTIAGEKAGLKVYFPEFVLCTDNAAMIASQGYFNLMAGIGLSDTDLGATSSIPL